MAGIETSQLRSAFIAETTAGTTPATPGFTNSDTVIDVKATPKIIESTSLAVKGARRSQALAGFEVAGSVAEAPLIYGVNDTWFETLLQGTWSTNVLKNGQSQKTVTVENAIPAGVGGTTTMMRYRGVEATAAKITLQAGAEARIGFDVVGIGSDDATTTAIFGATYTDQSEKTPLSSGADVGTITATGKTLDCIQSAEISLEFTGRDAQPKLSSNDLCGYTRGALKPRLMLRVYVDTNFMALYNDVRAAQTAFAVNFPIGSVTGKKYTINFPACRFAKADLDFSGDTAFHDIEILPEYDSTAASVVTITRAVA